MANTYNLIASNVLTSSVSTVTFSSIPNTYTDLILRCSVRSPDSSVNDVNIAPNSLTSSNNTNLGGSGSSVMVNGYLLTSVKVPSVVTGVDVTSDTFGNVEMHFANYLANAKKSIYSFGVGENNIDTSYISSVASLWPHTAAISSLVISTALSFSIGSSFYLYGIKNT